MDLVFQAIVLGIVQGLTEFLPISSSAHLIVIPALLGWDVPLDTFINTATFDVMLHAGTLIALLIYFWRDVVRLLVAFFASIRDRSLNDDHDRRLAWLLLISVIPAAVLGALFESFFDTYFRDNLLFIPVLMLVGALVLYVAERIASHTRKIWEITWLDSLLLGIAQALALFPGISRSGITIAGGLFLGMERPAAARFAFLMGIPVIAGATVWKLRDLGGTQLTSNETLALAAGMAAAAISGVLTIRFLLRYLQNHNTDIFVAYRIGFAIVVAVLLLVR
jgi:undecaprenyl-diphosphatase